MVDLADRGVFREQQAVALAQFGDIAHEEQAADHFVGFSRRVVARRRHHRHTAAEQGDVGSLLELLDDRFEPFVRLSHRPVMESEFGETHPDRVGLDPDTMECRVGVRRHVVDRSGGVEKEHAIADTRR